MKVLEVHLQDTNSIPIKFVDCTIQIIDNEGLHIYNSNVELVAVFAPKAWTYCIYTETEQVKAKA